MELLLGMMSLKNYEIMLKSSEVSFGSCDRIFYDCYLMWKRKTLVASIYLLIDGISHKVSCKGVQFVTKSKTRHFSLQNSAKQPIIHSFSVNYRLYYSLRKIYLSLSLHVLINKKSCDLAVMVLWFRYKIKNLKAAFLFWCFWYIE